MYKFSAPMPYNTDDINKIININKQIEKSRITDFYLSLPHTCELFTGFEQYRNLDCKNTNFSYWENLISYSIEQNIDIIYLLNRPNLNYTNQLLNKQLEKLDILLNKFRKIGVNKLRVAEHKLLKYLNKNYPDFVLYASTSFEYKTIGEYKNFMYFNPYIKQIVPSHDNNKNFKLLKNLVKDFPYTEIEIIVNQGCINSCPFRFSHNSFSCDDIKLNKLFSQSFYLNHCCMKKASNPLINMILSNFIYPWDIYEYKKIGITKFKFTGRDNFTSDTNQIIKQYLMYLKGIENYNLIQDIAINSIIEKFADYDELKFLRIKEYKKYLPNINHFKKYGHLCASYCGIECRYCYKCADKIQKVFMKKQEKMRKRRIPLCVITKQTL